MKRILYVIMALAAMAMTACCKADKPVVRHVILIGSDGFSSTVMREHPGAFPNIEKLMAEGSYTLERRSVLPSSSSVNWASMLMGAGPEIHGYTTWGSQTPDLPSRVLTENGLFPCIMYLLRNGYPDAEIGCGYTWGTIGKLFEPSAVNFNHHNSSGKEENLTRTMCEYIENNKPTMTFISFDEPDHTGHASGWESEEYFEMCKKIDGYVGSILASAEKAGMMDDLIVIFTSDHGGINKGHGGKTMNEMEAPLVLWGKGIKSGHEIQESVMMFDTASTIAHIFKLEQPQVWIGRPVMSAFE